MIVNHMAHNMRYRAELDGVRAVAVLAVVFYHAKLSLLGYELFKGGFFGVDIFFVLSGFLITSIIFSDLAKNHFSIRDFFLRRAKRILPALILVLLISSFFAYIFYCQTIWLFMQRHFYLLCFLFLIFIFLVKIPIFLTQVTINHCFIRGVFR